MNDSLLNSLSKLHESIENDPRILRLNELDEKMNNDEEVMKLAYRKNVAITEYEDALRFFKDGSPEVQAAQKKLHEAKLNLDLNPLVQEYNKAFKEVQLMYQKINGTLFDKFAPEKRCLR